jgi:predicted membrane chloride channel (bestrophin family)
MTETQALWRLILGAFAVTVLWQRFALWMVIGGLVAIIVGLWGTMLVGLLTGPPLVVIAVAAAVWIDRRAKNASRRVRRSQ